MNDPRSRRPPPISASVRSGVVTFIIEVGIVLTLAAAGFIVAALVLILA